MPWQTAPHMRRLLPSQWSNVSFALLYNYAWDDEFEKRPGPDSRFDMSDIKPDDVSMSDLDWLLPPGDGNGGDDPGDDADMDEFLD